MGFDKITEEEKKNMYITPALIKSGWTPKQMRMETYITPGRIIVRGDRAERAKGKKTDYILVHKNNKPLAIVEANFLLEISVIYIFPVLEFLSLSKFLISIFTS